MNEALRDESARLARSWLRHDEAMLRDYLVADVEDPRLNAQSILTRHFLIQALTGDRSAEFMEAELRFASAMNWLLELVRSGLDADEAQAIQHALERGADNAEGRTLPPHIVKLHAALPARACGQEIANYLGQFLSSTPPPTLEAFHRWPGLDTFANRWPGWLASVSPPPLRVLEVACGSANDYRFLVRFGLAPWLDYTGIDLCEKNIFNARLLFPEARFEVGNVFALPAADASFDCCFVHDLFEHLSLSGLEQSVSEICRVTRQRICAGFFSMHEGPEHWVRPVDEYHWNTLSLGRTRGLFEQHGFAVEAIHIGTLLKWRYGGAATHNPDAYTLLAHRTV